MCGLRTSPRTDVDFCHLRTAIGGWGVSRIVSPLPGPGDTLRNCVAERLRIVVVTMTGPVGSRAPAAGLLGRLARIVVTSLVMSGCGSGWTAHGQLCAEDEFFDTVVDRCSLCRDVCDLCLRPESGHFCSRNCPGSRGPELSVGLFIYLLINSGIEFNTSITQIQGSQQQQYKQ